MTIGKKMPSRGWIVGLVGGAIALTFVGVGVFRLFTSKRPAPTTEATVAPRVEVVALGRLEPRGEVIRVSGPTGERIGKMLVKQGERVQTGQVLAYLESYGERQAERQYAASQLAEAEAKLQATTAYGQAQVQTAQTRIDQSQRPGSFEIAAQQAKVRELTAQLALDQTDLTRSRSLRQEGAISQQELDRQLTKVRQSQELLKNAQASLVQIQTRWQSDVQNAQAQFQAERANLPLSQIQVAVESARQNLNLAEAKLDRTLVRAPSPGRILRIVTHAGEAIGDNGILDLGDTSQMVAVAEVYETDVGLVKLGQSATITSRNGAFDTALTGKVYEIGWQIFKNDVLDDDPAANADARVVEVKIRLDNSQAVEALTNLQVDTKINVRR